MKKYVGQKINRQLRQAMAQTLYQVQEYFEYSHNLNELSSTNLSGIIVAV